MTGSHRSVCVFDKAATCECVDTSNQSDGCAQVGWYLYGKWPIAGLTRLRVSHLGECDGAANENRRLEM